MPPNDDNPPKRLKSSSAITNGQTTITSQDGYGKHIAQTVSKIPHHMTTSFIHGSIERSVWITNKDIPKVETGSLPGTIIEWHSGVFVDHSHVKDFTVLLVRVLYVSHPSALQGCTEYARELAPTQATVQCRKAGSLQSHGTSYLIIFNGTGILPNSSIATYILELLSCCLILSAKV
jgi:hypothetical protein